MLIRPRRPGDPPDAPGPDPVDRISLFAGIIAILGGIEGMDWYRGANPDASELVIYAIGFAIPFGAWAVVQLLGRPFRRRPDDAA
ncbi:hypothetical protein [Zavarzinia sp. CC-PAN008]|uniref:hypothetical protein n=1 Tax=Zavarzinia sp. CC-PAN008 TaxID=3243332 RepID=UPI003F74201C